MKRLAFLLITLIAMATSVAIAVDYYRPSPTYCGFGAGCDEVIHASVGRVLGVPLPVFGIVSFGTFYGIALRGERSMRLLGPMALFAGGAGALLVGVQVVGLGRTCPLCLIVNACGMALAATEIGFPASNCAAIRRRWPWLAAACVAMAAPIVWPIVSPAPEVPSVVRDQWTDQIDVVEITDFQCQHCRDAEPVLAAFLGENPRLRFVRLVSGVDGGAKAKKAAAAYRCAEAQGRGERMAAALFATRDYSSQNCEAAFGIDLDGSAFRACLSSVTAADDKVGAAMRDSGIRGLPAVWIEDQLVLGVPSIEALRAALRRAERSVAAQKSL